MPIGVLTAVKYWLLRSSFILREPPQQDRRSGFLVYHYSTPHAPPSDKN